jgi:hypothetical protein
MEREGRQEGQVVGAWDRTRREKKFNFLEREEKAFGGLVGFGKEGCCWGKICPIGGTETKGQRFQWLCQEEEKNRLSGKSTKKN